MNIQYISDVHLELAKTKPSLPVRSDILALCGDIGSPLLPIVQSWIEELAQKFKHIFWVPGNHEYYNAPMDVTNRAFEDLMDKHTNLHVLMNDRYDIDHKVTILGTTLWSDIDFTIAKYINDFKYIKVDSDTPLTPQYTTMYHNMAVRYIDDQLTLAEKERRNVIVLTHHAAHPLMNGKFHGGPLSSAFASNLEHLFRPPLKLWINGHTHENLTLLINNIPCTANCLGYSGEKTKGVLDAVYQLDFQ